MSTQWSDSRLCNFSFCFLHFWLIPWVISSVLLIGRREGIFSRHDERLYAKDRKLFNGRCFSERSNSTSWCGNDIIILNHLGNQSSQRLIESLSLSFWYNVVWNVTICQIFCKAICAYSIKRIELFEVAFLPDGQDLSQVKSIHFIRYLFLLLLHRQLLARDFKQI